MTTTVTVTAAGHEVLVTDTPTSLNSGETTGTTTKISTQGETRTFYAHSGNVLTIEEGTEPTTSAIAQMNVGGSISDVSQEQIDAVSGADAAKRAE